MTAIVKMGVIGLGAIGDRILKSIQAEDGIQITAVCDVNEQLVKSMTEEYKVKGYLDYREMLEQAALDIVYVAVPPKYHEKIVLDVIEANKHVLCEKPLANSVDEGKRMLAAAEQKGLVHAMHFPLNYQAPLNEFERRIKEGYIGELRRIRLVMHFPHWPRLWQQNDWVGGKEQGGYVLEVGVHWIQALQRIFGSVAQVKSQLQFPNDPQRCENSIVAELSLTDGTPVMIDGLSDISGDELIEFAAYGSEGTIMLRNWRSLWLGKNGQPLEEVTVDSESATRMMKEIAKAVNRVPANIYDFRAGLHAQYVLDALRHPPHSNWQQLDTE
ncbi:Gfo/Idh/MocA family protein [Bacillus horti]|uniref:Dehydrogenase n=1 Tax=Caldalkalibacillus horti TaxID=77523 RepID=A0ABT9W2F2_9BACI|nr:Gfo/Idh/MocA family oxidoreductase [Bacillus horti]MDQ0167411.1 putative dehydrogenase [Bacillus horti]